MPEEERRRHVTRPEVLALGGCLDVGWLNVGGRRGVQSGEAERIEAVAASLGQTPGGRYLEAKPRKREKLKIKA